MHQRTIQTERSKGARRRPERTCVGCGLRGDASDMVRLAIADGQVVFDLGGGAFGRGAHLHPRPACLEGARRGLSRALHAQVDVDARRLGELLVAACERRATGLLLAARRLHALEVGAEATARAATEGAALIVVACDAGAVARGGVVARAAAEGRAIAWGTKEGLGALLGYESVAVCAVRHDGLAGELKRLRAAADAGASVVAGQANAGTTEGAGCRSPEAG